ncbi:MAG: FAD-dependent oxidoreductase [Nanoarchaeota archaeon]
MEYDVAIIGGGVAGLGAAIYSGRFNLKVAIFAETMGGTIILTDVVENYPGFKRITGFDLAEELKKHMADYKVDVFEERVSDVRKSGKHFEIQSSERTIKSKTVIFATGTKFKKLNVSGEEEYTNKGVHYCALCDGAFFKGKLMAVVGGSDSAAKEALLLTQWAEKVYIIYRGDKIHPEPINMTRVEKNNKIEMINNTNIKEIKGDGKKVSSALLDKDYNGSKEFKVDAIFVAIGHNILSELPAKLGVKLNEKKEVIIDRNAKTNIPGVYACGDLVDTEFKQAITGVAEGVLASYSAYQYLSNENI